MKYFPLNNDKTLKTYTKDHVISKINRPPSFIKRIDYVVDNFDIFSERKKVSNIITIGEIYFEEGENINLEDILKDTKDTFLRFIPATSTDNELSIEVRKKVWSWETDGDLVKRLYKLHFPTKTTITV